MNRLAPAIIAALLLCGTLGQRARSQTGRTNKNSDATVSGRITIKGKPAPGVVVALRLNQSMPSYSGLKATTDQDGRYRIANVPAGIYRVIPAAPAFVISDPNKALDQNLVISEGDNVAEIDFDLVRGGVITGKVTDTDGRPVVEETIRLLTANYPRSGGPHVPRDFQTDDRGIYRIFGIPAGRYKVSIGEESLGVLRWPGRARTVPITFHPNVTDAAQATVVEVGEGTEATNIDITLASAPRTFSVSGRVVDGETGQPVTNVPISLMKIIIIDARNSQASGGGTAVRSNSDGEFVLDKLPAGKYSISIQPPPESNLRAESVRFDLVDQDVTGLVIKAASGATLSGTVVLERPRDGSHAGAPPAWLSVYLRNDAAGFSSNQGTQLKPDGSFKIGGLTAGMVGFSVGTWSPYGDARPIRILRLERDGVDQPDGIKIQAGEHVTGIRIIAAYSSGSIRGVVKLENGILPPSGHLVVSVSRAGDNSPNDGGYEPDARGRFLISGLATGTYELRISAYIPEWRQTPRITKQVVNVTDGAATDVLVIVDLTPPKKP